MTVDPAQHRRGALRPVRPWQRHPTAELRLRRLVADVEAERDRWPDGSPVHDLLDSAAAVLTDCAAAAADPA
jgi:hypothetical protein